MRNTVIGVFGRKGSGKSFLIKRELEQLERFLVWDAMGEYAHAESGAGYSGARQWISLTDFAAELQAKGDYGREVFVLPREDFPRWCKMVYELGRAVAVIEETSRYTDPGPAFDALADLLDRGRHRQVDLIFASPRPVGIPRSFTQQADLLVVFRQTEPADVEYFTKKLGRSEASVVDRLPEYASLRVAP